VEGSVLGKLRVSPQFLENFEYTANALVIDLGQNPNYDLFPIVAKVLVRFPGFAHT
jgi:hypothetical protein